MYIATFKVNAPEPEIYTMPTGDKIRAVIIEALMNTYPEVMDTLIVVKEPD